MSKKKLFDFDDGVIHLLQDFCAANYDAKEVRVVSEAIKFFVAEHLRTEPKLRERFEDAKKERVGENVHRLRISN